MREGGNADVEGVAEVILEGGGNGDVKGGAAVILEGER